MKTDRRALIADAAISTLAAGGQRGLTHRAVDRAAGVPEGSTSYYFRTRDALLAGTLERMTELDDQDAGNLAGLGEGSDFDELPRLLAGLVRRMLTSGRERTLARYELTLESTRRPWLRTQLIDAGAHYRVMAEQFIAAAGVDEPRRRSTTMIAFMDGLIYDQLAGAGAGRLDEDGLVAACRDLVNVALR